MSEEEEEEAAMSEASEGDDSDDDEVAAPETGDTVEVFVDGAATAGGREPRNGRGAKRGASRWVTAVVGRVYRAGSFEVAMPASTDDAPTDGAPTKPKKLSMDDYNTTWRRAEAGARQRSE